MSNNPALYILVKNKPMKERFQDVKKNEIKFLWKIWVDVEHNYIKIKLPQLITKRNDITPLLNVN